MDMAATSWTGEFTRFPVVNEVCRAETRLGLWSIS